MTNTEILTQLARLDAEAADDLETQWLEFKPWTGSREDMRVAVEYAVCFANEDLLGKAAYTRLKGIDPIRYREWAREFVEDHGSITPRECRELLGLGGQRRHRWRCRGT